MANHECKRSLLGENSLSGLNAILKKIQKRPAPNVKDGDRTTSSTYTSIIISLVAMLVGPLFLIYLVLRCEKNQCLLVQLPLVIPTQLGVYISHFSIHCVCGYIVFLLFLASTHVPAFTNTVNQAFSVLLTSSACLFLLAYGQPTMLNVLFNEYLRLLCTTVVLCYILSILFYALANFGLINKSRDQCWAKAIFYGNTLHVQLADIELKYFFYVYAGMIGWALLDLIILLDLALQNKWNISVIFLTVTQYFFIGYTLYFERFMRLKPFVRGVGLGYFWLMRILMYLPFLHSLPVYCAAVSEVTLPRPMILLNFVIYLFGIIVYISSTQQKETFAEDPHANKNLRFVAQYAGTRYLVSGYWGMVQRPDYFGYAVIWFSWTMACGFTYLSLIVLTVVYLTLYAWLEQSIAHKQKGLGASYPKYETLVPKKLIPYIY